MDTMLWKGYVFLSPSKYGNFECVITNKDIILTRQKEGLYTYGVGEVYKTPLNKIISIEPNKLYREIRFFFNERKINFPIKPSLFTLSYLFGSKKYGLYFKTNQEFNAVFDLLNTILNK